MERGRTIPARWHSICAWSVRNTILSVYSWHSIATRTRSQQYHLLDQLFTGNIATQGRHICVRQNWCNWLHCGQPVGTIGFSYHPQRHRSTQFGIVCGVWQSRLGSGRSTQQFGQCRSSWQWLCLCDLQRCWTSSARQYSLRCMAVVDHTWQCECGSRPIWIICNHESGWTLVVHRCSWCEPCVCIWSSGLAKTIYKNFCRWCHHTIFHRQYNTDWCRHTVANWRGRCYSNSQHRLHCKQRFQYCDIFYCTCSGWTNRNPAYQSQNIRFWCVLWGASIRWHRNWSHLCGHKTA